MSEAEAQIGAEAEDERPSLGWRSSWALAVPVLIVLLSLVGIGAAGYLTYTHWFGKSVACAGFGGCDVVANSEYAHIWKIPVALIGVIGYVALLGVAAFWLRVGDRFGDWPLLAIWGMSLGGTAYSAYLTYLELFVIDAICIWCATSAVVMLCVLLVSTIALVMAGRVSAGED